MNILFGALFIIILILPGIIFRVSYLNIPYARKTFKSSFIDELLFSLVPALIIQVPCYSFVNYCLKGVDEKILYLLLINSDKVLANPMPEADKIRQFMEEKQYYYMSGDYFVIPYSEIKNLNITYQNESRINEMIQRMIS